MPRSSLTVASAESFAINAIDYRVIYNAFNPYLLSFHLVNDNRGSLVRDSLTVLIL